jgi:hypothetical protein
MCPVSFENLILSKIKLSWKPNALQAFSLHVNSFIQNLVADIPDQVRPHGYLASCFLMDPKNWT